MPESNDELIKYRLTVQETTCQEKSDRIFDEINSSNKLHAAHEIRISLIEANLVPVKESISSTNKKIWGLLMGVILGTIGAIVNKIISLIGVVK